MIGLTATLTSVAAHNAVVTSAVFAPHPSLIVPQDIGAEKPEEECKSLDSTDSETIPSGTRHSQLCDSSQLCLFECFKCVAYHFRSPKDRPHRGTTLCRLHWSH